MLNPNRPKNTKFLIGFLVFLSFKPITLKHRGRGGGGFLIFSSFPNHDAKKKKTTHTHTHTRGQTALERVREQKTQ